MAQQPRMALPLRTALPLLTGPPQLPPFLPPRIFTIPELLEGGMSLAKKLNLKEGMTLRLIGKPAGVDLDDVRTGAAANADGVLLFVTSVADLDATGDPAIEAAREDRIAWVAYPKGGQLETDLNRDILWRHLEKQGIQGVRQISIDDVWSALRFRPK